MYFWATHDEVVQAKRRAWAKIHNFEVEDAPVTSDVKARIGIFYIDEHVYKSRKEVYDVLTIRPISTVCVERRGMRFLPIRPILAICSESKFMSFLHLRSIACVCSEGRLMRFFPSNISHVFGFKGGG